ncbi:capsule biosynthesis protein CapA [Halomonas litopenaei]|uniref:Capsule biosynthesis protein CapA n=1 Tax=Halomonas litopenaei TaxID=2109328 RepID=A0ABX5IXT0_9GAMM|nr:MULTISPECIES: capsular biosynthesis protein [Halomonas]PTL91239.1 capsule biosynthesis protein CapA [Halomonas sp. SYSU XM8]PTL95285.1 capsule biosynthesis protein CapA [Halomonas litopenaei]
MGPFKARQFLLLQGPCSPFFTQLARTLADQGHGVHVLDLCGGDLLYRWRLGGQRYRGDAASFGELIDDFLGQRGISDLVVFGDQRPLHRLAVQAAERQRLRVHVFEEGYLRPHWITLEPQGVNGCSRFPRDPARVFEAAHCLGPAEPPVPCISPFLTRATHDVIYHLAGVLNPLLFPGYRGHAPVSAPREYAAYAQQLTRKRLLAGLEANLIKEFLSAPAPYFVLLLQLDSDAQIRCHSPFPDMARVLEETMTSFARDAPARTRLLIKNHPLDPGLSAHHRRARRLARELGIDRRVLFIEGGDLNHLLPSATGAITVNSTSGFVALEHGCPLLTLGEAIYTMPGLATGRQRVPAGFWHAPPAPNAALYQALRTTLLRTVQLNGSFYCRLGIRLGVHHSARRLVAERSPLEELLSCLPAAA